MISSVKKTLQEFSEIVQKITIEDYTATCHALSNATIGEHTRHILETFQCLLSQYELGCINYDDRKRDVSIQTQPNVALQVIDSILNKLDRPNKELKIQAKTYPSMEITSNYYRELHYNLDHCIHHQALIKVAINLSNCIEVDENFGVAKSTIEYRKQCVQ